MLTSSELLMRSVQGQIAHAVKSEPLLFETMRSEARAIMEHLQETQNPVLQGSVRELLRAFFLGRRTTPGQERVLLSMPKQMLSFDLAVDLAALALLSTALTNRARDAQRLSEQQAFLKRSGQKGK